MIKKRWVLAVAGAFLLGGGGGAFAASHYAITSTRQIAPSVLRQLRGARGPRGPRGAQGFTGAAGAAGAAGAGVKGYQFIVGPNVVVSPDAPENSSTASCPSGDEVLSGGFQGTTNPASVLEDTGTQTNGLNGWTVVISLDGADSEESFEATAICVSIAG